MGESAIVGQAIGFRRLPGERRLARALSLDRTVPR
jgi:hypothetical protein